jgi:catechol 2,3-dioxygenase-like lactoylglutathione lyase family enzyme
MKKSNKLVGGVNYPRPFKIKRLGHFGFNVESPEVSLRFYRDLLGFEISDPLDFGPRLSDEVRKKVGPTVGYFTRHGSDHHSFVLFPRATVNAVNPHYKNHPDLTINQITWQVGTLQEVVEGHDWFEENQIQILRSGRDTPGSNWHFYPVDPAGHINELYYGIEQIGWNGLSKPSSLHAIKYMKPPELPHPSEYAEIQLALTHGVDLHSGWKKEILANETYDVGGVLLARPFKVSKIGPLHLWVDDIQTSLDFYTNDLGLTLTEELIIEGERCVFLRANTEHHSLGLFSNKLIEKLNLKLPNPSSLLSFGFQLGSFQQLCQGIEYLLQHGCELIELPLQFSPGMGHHVYFRDPDGFLIQLYWEMEQIGWDGRPKPQALRRVFNANHKQWPSQLDPTSDSFAGEVFMGPLN